jgi:hypothetical protein
MFRQTLDFVQTVLQDIKKFLAFYETQNVITASNKKTPPDHTEWDESTPTNIKKTSVA